MLVEGGNLARTRRRGDNAGMAGDDGRAQVQLGEDTLARRRRDLGEDHPGTLAAASDLAVSLRAAGEYQAARELDEDTLARRRRVLGEDHPDTLASADNLVMILGRVGEEQAARELAEDTLARRRRLLGDEHPETIMAGAFDLILRGLDLGGEPEWMAALREASKRRQQEARELNEDEPG